MDLLNVFLVHVSFLAVFFLLHCYIIIPSINDTFDFFSCYLYSLYLLNFSYCLAEVSSTVLKRNGNNRHSGLFLISMELLLDI